MLWDTAAVLDVLGAAAGAGRRTRSGCRRPRSARTACARSRPPRPDLRLVDAPVLGTKGPAEQGKLVALLSGAPADVAAARPAIDGYSARSVYAGRAARRGQRAQAGLQRLGGHDERGGRAVRSRSPRASGSTRRCSWRRRSGGASDTPYLHMKAELIAKGEFPPSFTLDGRAQGRRADPGRRPRRLGRRRRARRAGRRVRPGGRGRPRRGGHGRGLPGVPARLRLAGQQLGRVRHRAEVPQLVRVDDRADLGHPAVAEVDRRAR